MRCTPADNLDALMHTIKSFDRPRMKVGQIVCNLILVAVLCSIQIIGVELRDVNFILVPRIELKRVVGDRSS